MKSIKMKHAVTKKVIKPDSKASTLIKKSVAHPSTDTNEIKKLSTAKVSRKLPKFARNALKSIYK